MRALSFLILAAAFVATGCDDDPFGFIDWTAEPDTAVIHSLSRPELAGRASAFDFADVSVVGPHAVVVENPASTGRWDVALTERQGELALAPAGAFPGLPEGAGIATLDGATFEDVTEAPADLDDYVRTEAVPLSTGAIYVVRTRTTSTLVGACIRYAKLEPLALDPAAGTFEFAYVRNPNCNTRGLVSSEDDD